MPAAPEIPSAGQLVHVRQRRYVVEAVHASGAPVDPLLGGGAAFHLVDLASIEEDGAGEELRVVWEIEPGAEVYERAALPAPTAFDPPGRLDAFLDAVRWGAVASADVRQLHAPFRSGITIEDYQLDPVVRALQMPRVNLLVADDVGLGKTIEAGLVVQELLIRHRARTVLVVCPAGLQIQWRDQMRDKFGLEFRIVDSDHLKELRRRRGLHVNPFTSFPRLVTSIDYLKRDRPMQWLREALPAPGDPVFPRRFDLLIVDEAHNVAPSGGGRYAVDSLRTRAVRTLTPHFEHRLFLTATPHNGYPESFSALLELLDEQRFHRGTEIDRAQLAAVMVRRMKSELPPKWDGSPRFPRRELIPLEVRYTDAERRAHQDLREYTRLRLEAPADDAERYASEFVLKLLKKRMFSSPAAFLATLEQHEKTRRDAARLAAGRPSLPALRRQVEEAEDESSDDEAWDEWTEEALATAARALPSATPDEQRLLGSLRAWASRAARLADSKADVLLDWLDTTLRPKGAFNDERVLVFTEYRATQDWLLHQVAARGLAEGGRVALLHGGLDAQAREGVKAAFQASPRDSAVRVLLATDAASEGIDLQNHCHRLVHYEIPWNPNRLEQRNGRVDRHGQRAPKVLIHHFVAEGWDRPGLFGTAPGELASDLEFLMRAAQKVEQIREDLGKVGPVIAAQVEQAMLGRRRSLDTSRAERDAEPARRMLKVERDIRDQLARLHERLHQDRAALHLTPDRVKAVVDVGLALAGHPPLRPVDVGLALAGHPPLRPVDVPGPSPGGRAPGTAWAVPPLPGSWAACAEGLAHPHTHEVRPVVFDHDLAAGRDDVVLAHLQHRLVQMCLRLLRAEVWSPEGRRTLHRVTARLAPDAALASPVALAHARLVVLGKDGHRLHEELIAAGGRLHEGRFQRLNVGEVQSALAAARADAAGPAVERHLAGLWDRIEKPLLQALDVRAEDRRQGIARALADRAAREVADIEAVLTELRRSIDQALRAPGPLQLDLFDGDERAQYERDRATLATRRDEIPGEIEREKTAIRSRYASPTPRLFPVSVTFVVPDGIARGLPGQS